MISDSKNPEFSNSGAFWAPESDEILENDDEQLWFDPWEGQIELSVHKDLSPEKTILNDEILLEENLQNLETSRRNSLLLCRQTSLPGSLFSTSNNSPGKFDNFHSTHTLFWNQRHDSSEDVSCRVCWLVLTARTYSKVIKRALLLFLNISFSVESFKPNWKWSRTHRGFS